MTDLRKALKQFKRQTQEQFDEAVKQYVATVYLTLKGEVVLWSDTGRTIESVYITSDVNVVQTPKEGDYPFTVEPLQTVINNITVEGSTVFYVGIAVPYGNTLEYGDTNVRAKAPLRYTFNKIK